LVSPELLHLDRQDSDQEEAQSGAEYGAADRHKDDLLQSICQQLGTYSHADSGDGQRDKDPNGSNDLIFHFDFSPYYLFKY
jgi:hypothetical protein